MKHQLTKHSSKLTAMLRYGNAVQRSIVTAMLRYSTIEIVVTLCGMICSNQAIKFDNYAEWQSDIMKIGQYTEWHYDLSTQIQILKIGQNTEWHYDLCPQIQILKIGHNTEWHYDLSPQIQILKTDLKNKFNEFCVYFFWRTSIVNQVN